MEEAGAEKTESKPQAEPEKSERIGIIVVTLAFVPATGQLEFLGPIHNTKLCHVILNGGHDIVNEHARRAAFRIVDQKTGKVPA